MIRFDNVGLRYGAGEEVLRDVSFDLNEGGFYFVTGPSGAGKSSLLRLMYLGQRASRGLITLFGEDIQTLPRKRLPELRRKIGVVFQDFRLIDHLSVFDNVALPLKVTGAKESAYRDNVMDLIEWVGLGDRADALPPTLSGGEQQRVAIARAVVNRPALLVADEPTGNVDPEMGDKLMRLFEALNKIGTTTIVATHDLALVHRFSHPVLAIDKGEVDLLADGLPASALDPAPVMAAPSLPFADPLL